MSKKIKDEKNRWRNKTVAFRVSPEEWEMIEQYVALSGLLKQDYLIARVLNRDIIVCGNSRTYTATVGILKKVLEQLQRIEKINDDNDEILTLIDQINKTVYGFGYEKSPYSDQ